MNKVVSMRTDQGIVTHTNVTLYMSLTEFNVFKDLLVQLLVPDPSTNPDTVVSMLDQNRIMFLNRFDQYKKSILKNLLIDSLQ